MGALQSHGELVVGRVNSVRDAQAMMTSDDPAIVVLSISDSDDLKDITTLGATGARTIGLIPKPSAILRDAAIDAGAQDILVAPGPERLESSILSLAGILDKGYELLGAPPWPEDPHDGDTHPLHLCRVGSQLYEATITTVYREKKWYLQG